MNSFHIPHPLSVMLLMKWQLDQRACAAGQVVQLSKTATSTSRPSSSLSCLPPADNDEMKAWSWNAIYKTNFLLLQNLFYYLHHVKNRQNTTSLVQHCSDLRAPVSRELQMTQGKGKTGWDQRSMKHCALLLHFCCSRTTAIRGITWKQPFWGVSLLNNWKTNVHEAQ